MAAAASSGLPERLTGFFWLYDCSSSGDQSEAKGDTMRPKATVLAVMPSAPYCWAMWRDRAIKPALEHIYEGPFKTAVVRPALDETLTIRPYFCACLPGIKTLHISRAAVRLIFNTSCHSSRLVWVTVHALPPCLGAMPALLTKIVSVPSCSCTWAKMGSGALLSARASLIQIKVLCLYFFATSSIATLLRSTMAT